MGNWYANHTDFSGCHLKYHTGRVVPCTGALARWMRRWRASHASCRSNRPPAVAARLLLRRFRSPPTPTPGDRRFGPCHFLTKPLQLRGLQTLGFKPLRLYEAVSRMTLQVLLSVSHKGPHLQRLTGAGHCACLAGAKRRQRQRPPGAGGSSSARCRNSRRHRRSLKCHPASS